MYRTPYLPALRSRLAVFIAAMACIGQPLLAEDLPIPDGLDASSASGNMTSATTLDVRVRSSADDAEESSGKSVSLTGSDLELIHDSTDQTVGIRWTGLAIPKGASITSAYVQFSSKESRSEAANLVIRGQATDNAEKFSTSSGNVSSRSRTSARVNWAPPSWSTDQAGSNQRTPNLKAIIQEIVNRSGWSSGNALALTITGSGRRTAWSYDGKSSAAPVLHVEFGGGGSGENPPEESGGTIAVYAGYYDTHHSGHPRSKPSPWKGSSDVVFVGKPDPGTSNEWDSSCIRIDNLTSSSLSSVSVTVTMGSKSFNLWGTNSIPAGKTLILAQTGFENFDGSDTSPAGCYGCNPNLCLNAVSSTRPVVKVTIGGKTTHYVDTEQILNTKGVDGAGCPYTGSRNDESHSWQRINSSGGSLDQQLVDGPEPAPLISVFEPTLSLAPPAPNPTRGDFAIGLVVPRRSAVRLGVYDAMGRLIKTYLNETLEAGEYRGRMDVTGTTPGVYFLRLSTPEGTQSRSFVLIN